MVNNKPILRARFAPSPTGYLHIGGARTCLFSWLYARKNKGEFILRIEDTDQERSKKEYLDEILESIEWLGMDWDQIYQQSQRFDIYREYAQKLINEGKAYKKDGAVFFKYDFQNIEINDLIRGNIVFTELPKPEEVIIKSDSSPTYNFSCVVDDALMKINCVIRGEDHISNTPKQILMYKALDFEIPQFAHLPLILSPGGGRMSKRFGATSIREYRQAGYLSESLVNYLLLLGWSPGENKEIIMLAEAQELFDLKKVNKTGAVFSLDKLNWLNGDYIRRKDPKVFTDLMKSYLEEAKVLPLEVSREYLEKVAGLFRERTVTLSELVGKTRFCFSEDFNYDQKGEKILETDSSKEVSFLLDKLRPMVDFQKEAIEQIFRSAAESLNLKLRLLVQPVRVALIGRKDGPGLFEVIELIGKDRVIKRLERLLKYWKDKKEMIR
ncbi:MAG: glutamate--tRNA ligase [Candidatus Omnitrophica bacterium]|nr:glutamate--tRNA ligase [Candidatus Omnitrophota bacterium]